MEIDFNRIKRILIIRLSSFGDILLTTPLVRSLKNQYPAIEIDFLLRNEYKDIYKYNSHLANLFLFENATAEKTTKELQSRNYDLIIDLQNNLRSFKITMRLKKPALKFHKSTLEKFLLVKFKINRMKELPQIPVRYSKVIPDFKLDNNGLDIFLPAGITSRIDRGDNYIGLCPGSKHFTKRWPLEYFIELGKSLSGNGFKIVLFGGIDDREICAKVANAIPFSIDLSNDNLLLQTAINMYNCKAIICNDSGLMHLACSVDIPVILIMGSTVKEFGFTPYQNKNLILENNLLSCRPCSHIGRNSCPQKHFKCMLDIRPSNVYENLKSFLSAE